MSYMGALEAAGAMVIRYAYFGPYQGTILVEVEYEGKHGYVEIINVDLDDCDAYTEQELANFGRKFLEEFFEPAEKLIEQFTRQEAGDMIKWVKEKANE